MKNKSGISVEAPPEAIFELLERDRTRFDNDELVSRESVGDVPFGLGYRIKAIVTHGGQKCSSTSVVTVFDPPWRLHEEWEHRCHVGRRTIIGSQRFEISVDHAGTLVVCELVERKAGLAGLTDRLFASLCNPAHAKAARLAMRAEALAASRDLSLR